MLKIKTAVRVFTVFLAVICIFTFGMMFSAYQKTSSHYSIVSGNELAIDCDIPLVIKSNNELDLKKQYNKSGSYNVKLSLLGIIPLRSATVDVVDDRTAYVIGKPFGMKVYTEGVLVVNLSRVDTAAGAKSPAQLSGLKINDSILTIDSQKVYTNDEVAQIIEKSGGKKLDIVIKRDGKIKNITLIPQLSVSTNTYKAGIWVRDSSAGIGTLTFYLPSKKMLCGLGHGISDNDTGKILSISSGELVKAEIISLKKAVKCEPGELKGRLLGEKYGDMILNCDNGVYATASDTFENFEKMPIAFKQEVSDGKAEIYTTLNGSEVQKFSCEIKKNVAINAKSDLLVKITDKKLLDTTGGIVQGMSGSPIVQNGKLVGAITHVLVENPNTGYAIYAENMLETAQTVANENKLKDVS